MTENHRNFFPLCLIGVGCLAAAVLFGPRYFSRMMDSRDLSLVAVTDRDDFSFLKQSSGQLLNQAPLLSSIGNVGELLLLTVQSEPGTWQSSHLVSSVYEEAKSAAAQGMLPWIHTDEDWQDTIQYAKYYSLTAHTDSDAQSREMLNLWYLRFSDEETFDYYFLVNALTYQIYYAEIYNEKTEQEEDVIGSSIQMEVSNGAAFYYHAKEHLIVTGSERTSYESLIVLHFEDGVVYLELTELEPTGLTEQKRKGYSVGFRGLAGSIRQVMS